MKILEKKKFREGKKTPFASIMAPTNLDTPIP